MTSTPQACPSVKLLSFQVVSCFPPSLWSTGVRQGGDVRVRREGRPCSACEEGTFNQGGGCEGDVSSDHHIMYVLNSM